MHQVFILDQVLIQA